MKKGNALLLSIAISVSMLSTAALADADKGQKVYTKMLKKDCGFSGAKMAGMHTQDEWEEIYEEGKLLDEIQKQCPNVRGVKEKYLPHLYDFFFKFGSDSGNVPAC